ncbi:MAG: PRC-barrel domain-containing protein [Acidimicrobiales bacterium]
MTNLWFYRATIGQPQRDLTGFDVEATDGSIGSVDENTTDRDHLVVDTGFWIFGKRRLLPAGVVDRIDYDDEKVYVNLTKDQVKDAPDLDESLDRSFAEWNRAPYQEYYHPYGW